MTAAAAGARPTDRPSRRPRHPLAAGRPARCSSSRIALRLAVPARLGRLHVAAAVSATRSCDGYVSLPRSLTLDNFVIGLERGRAAAATSSTR